VEDLSEHLRAWNRAQSARLKHMTFQLTADQLAVVDRALEYSAVHTVAAAEEAGNPNRRGNALHHLCHAYLDLVDRAGAHTHARRHHKKDSKEAHR